MEYKLNEKKMTLFFSGELNSYNSDSVEKEIELTLKDKTFSTLILDFSSLRYISSAGLRIILKLKQKYNDVHVIEASLEVYDVLNMTGFVNIMDVKKALLKIDIYGKELIGEGYFSSVYRLDKDTIIKVFNRTSDPSQIDRELKLSKQAFVLGIPTAISFDVVRVGDKLGVRFEMLDCKSLKSAFVENEDKYDEYIKKYSNLLKKINTTECFDDSLPNIKTFFLEKLDAIKDLIDEKHFKKAKKLLEGVKDNKTFVHGDCHFKNIMVQNDEFLLIDMDTLSIGNPIFELGTLRCPYVCFEEDDPGNSLRFLGIPGEKCKKLFFDLTKEYLGKEDEIANDKIAIISYLHMVWWNLVNTPDNKARLNGCRERLYTLLDKYDDLDIGL